MTTAPRCKVAILGGGLAGLTAAFELTEAAEPVDVTVYQMGWRLGGKGASGRNAHHAQRIEEHGIHVWAGFYARAFALMRRVYSALDRPRSHPMPSVWDAFSPAESMVLVEEFRGRYVEWSLPIPTDDRRPGAAEHAPRELEIEDHVVAALRVMARVYRGWRAAADGDAVRPPRALPRKLIDGGERLLRRAIRLASRQPFKSARRPLLAALEAFVRWLWRRALPRIDDDRLRQQWILINFIYGNLRGMLEDDVRGRGFRSLDDVDYRDWLGRFLVRDQVDGKLLTLDSPLAMFVYEGEYAFRDGDLGRPAIATGVALETLVRMFLEWRGAMLYKMNAGMGDVVFAPLYQVLEARGVRFRFFHRIEELELSTDRRRIERIHVGSQARLRAGVGNYSPLVEVKGLECWPSEPRWQQLDDADRDVHYESPFSPAVDHRTLKQGVDFDRVVLAIPVAALPHIAGELIDHSPAWRDMVTHVRTVRTAGVQLWLKRSLRELGWRAGDRPLTNPPNGALSILGDLSQVIEREDWQDTDRPACVMYVTGTLPDGEMRLGPRGWVDAAAPDQRANDLALRWRTASELLPRLSKSLPAVVPGSGTENAGAAFDWDLLATADADRLLPPRGGDRLADQYFRANVQPSERFTAPFPGSIRYRLAPGASGFDNLTLAGDWTDNGYNCACIEATVMSGEQAARHLTGGVAGDRPAFSPGRESVVAGRRR